MDQQMAALRAGGIDAIKGVCVFVLFDLILYIPVNNYGHVMSVHLATLFPGQALAKRLASTSCTYFRL